MFGACQTHRSENVTAVCLTCFVPLCTQCILIGSHGGVGTADHKIVSTVEALRVASQAVDDITLTTEAPLEARLECVRAKLAELFIQSDSVKSRIDSVAQ